MSALHAVAPIATLRAALPRSCARAKAGSAGLPRAATYTDTAWPTTSDAMHKVEGSSPFTPLTTMVTSRLQVA
jgi:hypothetical protein